MIVELPYESVIIKRCQDGDIDSFELIYRHYEKPMFAFALRLLERDEAQEAIQVSFIKLYQNIGKFRFQAKFSTYLFRILINVCHDLNKKKQKIYAEQIQNPKEAGYLPNSDLKIQLEQAIITLPKRMRECFILFAVEGFKQDEISEILNISIGTVKSHIFRAKQKLKILLADNF